MTRFPRPTALLAPLVLLATGACSLTPDYAPPQMALPASFKEAPGWQPAAPADAAAKGAWWKSFEDPVLDDLETRAIVSNQNLAAKAAAYREALASVRESRASLFPGLTLTRDASRTDSLGEATGTNLTLQQLEVGKTYSLSLGATWQPDLWGAIGNQVSEAGAEAQASEADLANATLSIQGQLASTYLQLRATDALAHLLDRTVEAYVHALGITRNRYREGLAPRSDVTQAQAQLASARADAADMGRQRAVQEHAIAVLAGANPSTFSIAPVAWSAPQPEVPALVPSTLLERRPDVAAAERRVAAANAGIGIRKAAFFPALELTASLSTSGSKLGDLFEAPFSFWSLGGSMVQSVFDFGGNKARLAQARAAYDQAVATYRQTVLQAFGDVEDGLVATQVLKTVLAARTQARDANTASLAIAMDRYLAGETAYTEVVTAQTTALAARQAEIEATLDRQLAIVALFQAVGGNIESAPESE